MRFDDVQISDLLIHPISNHYIYSTMRKLFALTFFVLHFTLSFGQHYNKAYGNPIVVLTITNPWLMVIGSDTPYFTIYQNGQIIYKKIIKGRSKFYEVKLTKKQVQSVIKSLNITADIFKLPKEIKTVYATDQPTNELILNFDSVKVVNVYGYLQNEKGEERLKTPKSFLTIYDNILKYKNDSAKAWLPDSVEVMLTSYSYAPEKSLKWPSNWPDLTSKSTIKRGDDLYSIYLDKRYLNDLVKLISSMKEKQAIQITGQKFSISYRFPFPNIQ